jgi:uracil-DNA glycosylase family 4
MGRKKPPFNKGSDTSEKAADSIASSASSLRDFVFGIIEASGAGGLTCDGVEVESHMSHQTTSARINELAKEGRIIDSGRQRPTRSGRLAVVWLAGTVSTSETAPATEGSVNGSPLFPQAAIDPPGEDGLAGLRRRCLSCRKCGLSKTRNKVVFGEGNPNEPVICFIGEGPGGTEDDTGRPFVGPAGKFLDKIFKAMKISRDEVYICNAVNCRPPDNRKPEKQELDACFEYLVGQIRAVRPKTLVCLGGSAVSALLGGKQEITKIRGKWLEWEGIPLMPTFHPSYLLRSQSSPEFVDLKKQVWTDMKQVLHKIGRPVPD